MPIWNPCYAASSPNPCVPEEVIPLPCHPATTCHSHRRHLPPPVPSLHWLDQKLVKKLASKVVMVYQGRPGVVVFRSAFVRTWWVRAFPGDTEMVVVFFRWQRGAWRHCGSRSWVFLGIWMCVSLGDWWSRQSWGVLLTSLVWIRNMYLMRAILMIKMLFVLIKLCVWGIGYCRYEWLAEM